jgi:hypothetical protein
MATIRPSVPCLEFHPVGIATVFPSVPIRVFWAIAAEGICQHANAPNMAHVIFVFMFCLVVLVLAFCLTCASATRVSALVAGVC